MRRGEIKKEGHREKEELKMEEGEVGSPSPNSHSEILPSHRKVSTIIIFSKEFIYCDSVSISIFFCLKCTDDVYS